MNLNKEKRKKRIIDVKTTFKSADHIYTLCKAKIFIIPAKLIALARIEGVNYIFWNQFRIWGVPETWIKPDEPYGSISIFLVVCWHFKTSPHSLQVFRRTLRHSLAVKLWKMDVHRQEGEQIMTAFSFWGDVCTIPSKTDNNYKCSNSSRHTYSSFGFLPQTHTWSTKQPSKRHAGWN